MPPGQHALANVVIHAPVLLAAVTGRGGGRTQLVCTVTESGVLALKPARGRYAHCMCLDCSFLGLVDWCKQSLTLPALPLCECDSTSDHREWMQGLYVPNCALYSSADSQG